MKKRIINKILSEIIEKCSNDIIKTKLAKLTQEEKNTKLEGKLNPFEQEHYHILTKNLSELKEKEGLGKFYSEEIDSIEKDLFFYEKRIYRGYDLSAKINNIPSYDINEFIVEEIPPDFKEDNLNPVILSVEQNQLNNDNLVDFDFDEVNALNYYFDDGSTDINSELNPKYANNYWGALSEEEKMSIMDKNEKITPFIENSIEKTDGLVANTILFHGCENSGIVNINSRLGDTVRLKSFISSSFHEDTGIEYGASIPNSLNKKLYVRFLAPKGTRGVCGNHKDLTNRFPIEHEYLLDKNQKGTIVNIDYDKGCITVLLD